MFILIIVGLYILYVLYRRHTLLKQVELFNRLLYIDKNPDKYISEINKLLRKMQSERERNINLIQKTTGLFYAGRFEEAVKILTVDINKIPPNWQHIYYHNLILCLFLKGDIEKSNEFLADAKEVLDDYAKKDYNKAAIELIYAVSDYYNGKGTDRIEFFNELAETGRNDYRIALSYYFLGKIYENENNEEKSKLCLEKAGKLGIGSFLEEFSLSWIYKTGRKIDLNIKESKNILIIEEVKDFELTHIFECGQCFRWNKEEDGSYTGVVKNKVINVSQSKNKLYFEGMNSEDYNSLLKYYFDFDTDYSLIKKSINVDEIIDKAIKFGHGIRILNQDEWETMISFMISANNRIPMIKKVIGNLSKNFGDYICSYRGKDYYTFPRAEKLSMAPLEKIQECKAGFRSERIKEAAERYIKEKEVIHNIKNRTYEEGLEYLKTYKGIGDKVANCILLFSMKQFDTFPVDVWVRRVMQTLYVDKKTSDKDIRKFAENKFGKLSGYAQQYLFYYAREMNIGK